MIWGGIYASGKTRLVFTYQEVTTPRHSRSPCASLGSGALRRCKLTFSTGLGDGSQGNDNARWSIFQTSSRRRDGHPTRRTLIQWTTACGPIWRSRPRKVWNRWSNRCLGNGIDCGQRTCGSALKISSFVWACVLPLDEATEIYY